jgi:hypothetical protein
MSMHRMLYIRVVLMCARPVSPFAAAPLQQPQGTPSTEESSGEAAPSPSAPEGISTGNTRRGKGGNAAAAAAAATAAAAAPAAAPAPSAPKGRRGWERPDVAPPKPGEDVARVLDSPSVATVSLGWIIACPLPSSLTPPPHPHSPVSARCGCAYVSLVLCIVLCAWCACVCTCVRVPNAARILLHMAPLLWLID